MDGDPDTQRDPPQADADVGTQRPTTRLSSQSEDSSKQSLRPKTGKLTDRSVTFPPALATEAAHIEQQDAGTSGLRGTHT